MPETVLITGIDGFTGRYLARLLAAKGHVVHGIVRSKSVDGVEGAAALHVADLNDAVAIREILASVRPGKIAHLAAIAFVAHGDVSEMYKTNILGTRSILEACAALDHRPTAVLVASSANIYGNAAEGILDENAAIVPANDYGISKVATEHLARIYADRVPVILVRPFNYTGIGQSDSFLVPKMISHVLRRAKTIELGNLDVARDISDVRTVVDVYDRLLDAPAAVGETFNVCSGTAVDLRDILDMCMRIGEHKLEIRVNPAFVRANDVRSLCGNRAKLESAIGPVIAPSLEETLRWMIEA